MPEEIKRTSEEWQKLKPEVKVLNPDGWDRKNFQYSWYEELITEEEYQNRIGPSTCVFSHDFFDKFKD